MKSVVVDTNILFAALQRKQSAIRQLLERPDIRYYTPYF